LKKSSHLRNSTCASSDRLDFFRIILSLTGLLCCASFVRYASSLFVVPTFSGMIVKGPNDATTWAKIEALVRFASKL
jgi:hypothetical protein